MSAAMTGRRVVGIALAAAVVGILVSVLVLRDPGPPYEDAAMLMRYSENLSDGHGIRWNDEADPVDGATDLVFMTLVAGGSAVGAPVDVSARVLAAAAHLALLIGLAWWAHRRRLDWRAIVVLAIPIVVGPGLRYSRAGFGTTVFALLVALCAVAVDRLTRDTRGGIAIGTGVALVALGVARPEGAIVAVLLLVAAGVFGPRTARRSIFRAAATFTMVGAAYFAWRWAYFGHPLPNPYYKKGSFELHWESLLRGARNSIVLLLPLLLTVLAEARRDARELARHLAPSAGFVLMWLLISDETNYLGRFQYAVVPLVVVAIATLPSSADVLGCRVAVVSACVLGLVALRIWWGPVREMSDRDGRYDVAVRLAAFPHTNVIVTTEAGLLPLYSGWTAIDAWGLNDEWIAHHGGVTHEYLRRFDPAVIVFQAPFAETDPTPVGTPALGPDFVRTSQTLRSFAREHDYVLAADFGDSASTTHYYYVRSGTPQTRALVQAIRSTRYFMLHADTPAIDFAREAALQDATSSE